MSPTRVENCVQSLMDDPNFKPKKPGQSKHDAAWALCTWLDQQGKLKATSDGVEITMDKAEMTFTGPFRVVLPITAARRQIIEKADGEEEIQLWLHVEASGPERDLDGDRFSEAGLAKMVEYAEKDRLNFLDGHHRDLLAAMLGNVYNPYLTKEKHFAFDVLLNSVNNPFAVQLFNDVLAGKRHGASIAGVVHDAEIEEFGDGEFGRIFNDVELIEVSRTSWPSYRDSFITLLANKVGKLPQEEFDQIVQRRKEVIEIMSKSCEGDMGENMIVKLDDGGEEIWADDERGVMVRKLKSPHGWDKKFSVSNVSWASVTNRSKPCQFAIIKMKEDGAFSRSKSGYPHHMPNCGTINRGGVIAAAGRLVQALKSAMPELEIPPIESLIAESIGVEEFEAHEEKAARFSRSELKFAARHILKHYRRDLDMEPPENLVAVAKSYEDETEEMVELVKNLVKMITREEKMPSDKETVETPEITEEPVVEESTEIVAEETVAETEEVEAETAVEETAEAEPEKSEAAGETPEEKTKIDSPLASKVDIGRLPFTLSLATFTMLNMVNDAVCGKDLDKAVITIDDFATLAKDAVTQLIQSGTSVKSSFLETFEEKIELESGQLTKSRIEHFEGAMKMCESGFKSLRKLFSGAPVIDDVEATEKMAKKVAKEAAKEAIQETAQVASQEKSELQKTVDRVMAEKEAAEAAERLAIDVMAEDKPAEPKTQTPRGDETPVVELTEEQKRQNDRNRFLKSLEGK